MWWTVLAALASWVLCVSDGHAGDGPPVELVGTVQSPKGGLAVCRDPSTGQTFSLRVGAGIDGWKLTAVRREDATFDKASVSVKVKISSPSGAAVSPPAAPAAAPSGAPIASAVPPGTPVVPPGKWMDGDGQIIDPPAYLRKPR